MAEKSKNDEKKMSQLDIDSLHMHRTGKPGKIEVNATKPLTTQRDLSLAYSPGVAAPCVEIAKNPNDAYDYTARGNLVAVVSNGTAVLGLGNIGALASKPVMEGKSVLFKRFADIDAIDLEVDSEDVDEVVNCVRFLGPTFGGINLEDIKAPECFIIEQRLREAMDIPIFHDDQHGTAIVSLAGMINALDLTNRDIKDITIVVNGAGAASIACIELMKAMGLPHDQAILCDSRGVIYQGRTDGMNQWKSAHAVKTKARSLEDAMEGADVFFGLSVAGSVTKKMVKSMAKNPIIFAMANPDPEITPEEVREVRDDAIVATGRSDYPNQVNNVLGFPYIFRGALDVRARTINDEMKIACAQALAELAREDVPDEVDAAYSGEHLQYGPDYIIPVPFDPRLMQYVPPRIAQAAMDTGVARQPIEDMDEYRRALAQRLDPTSSVIEATYEAVRSSPRRVVFAEGESERVIRAALSYRNQGLGEPILIGREKVVRARIEELGLSNAGELKIHNAALAEDREKYIDFLYERLQRQGMMYRDCARVVNQNRNVFAACMVALGDADVMVTGVSRRFSTCLKDVRRVFDPRPGEQIFGLTVHVLRNRTLFIADSSVHERPSPDVMVDIATQAAAKARQLGSEPRVAFLSYSNFGNPPVDITERSREAVRLLDERGGADFEYEGEMTPDVALDATMRERYYPFARLTGPANVLIMPGLHSAHITSRMLESLDVGTVLGPMLMGLDKPVQIVHMSSTVNELVNASAFGAHEAIRNESKPKRARKTKAPTRKAAE
ncbi:MAG: NADP-dependent malic enzyme [Alphaproteobacteria bacterium]|nr:NADP-dependent malic enzyme [Alphaproteobacteria bacterium]